MDQLTCFDMSPLFRDCVFVRDLQPEIEISIFVLMRKMITSQCKFNSTCVNKERLSFFKSFFTYNTIIYIKDTLYSNAGRTLYDIEKQDEEFSQCG